MKKSRKAVLGTLAVAAMLVLVPAVFATDLSASATPSTIAVGGSTTINLIYTGGSDTETALWVAVLTPSGNIYVLGGANSPNPVVSFAGNSGSGSPPSSCGVPYGTSGSLTVTGAGNTATVSDCSGSNNWYLSTVSGSAFYTTIEDDCTLSHSNPPTDSNPATSGDTSSSGLYTVLACYTSSLYTTSQFSADTSFSTPEFALGMGAVLAVSLVGVALVRKHSLGQISIPSV